MTDDSANVPPRSASGGGFLRGPENVVPLNKAPSEAEVAGDSLRRNEAVMIENAKVVARLRRASYLAYRESGFTAEEALVLCTK